jgi:hypothetical protein
VNNFEEKITKIQRKKREKHSKKKFRPDGGEE